MFPFLKNDHLAIFLFLRKNKNKENEKIKTQCFYLILDSNISFFLKTKNTDSRQYFLIFFSFKVQPFQRI